jgi:hypothetical protein
MKTKLGYEAFKIGVTEALRFFASLKKTEVPKQLAESGMAVLEATAKVAEEVARKAGR